MDLLDAFCSDSPLPSDINPSLVALIDQEDEVPAHAQAHGMVFRHALEAGRTTLLETSWQQVIGWGP